MLVVFSKVTEIVRKVSDASGIGSDAKVRSPFASPYKAQSVGQYGIEWQPLDGQFPGQVATLYWSTNTPALVNTKHYPFTPNLL